VTVATIDAHQGEENSVVILTMATDKKMGFMKDPARFSVAIIRGPNSLIILANWAGLKDDDRRALKRLVIIRNAFEKKRRMR
jgi:superfamily I DNA and/or RNA helicase